MHPQSCETCKNLVVIPEKFGLIYRPAEYICSVLSSHINGSFRERISEVGCCSYDKKQVDVSEVTK